jgi:thiol:disulfide interchange protein DsbA
MIKRRAFTAQMAAGFGLAATGLAHAQGSPVEGTHYVRLNTPVPVPSGGKIDVIEFFWYGCPHCYAFEPTLDSWSKKLPADVAFRRVHVGFTAMHETHARIYYALDALGQVEAMHRKVFNAIHQQRLQLLKEADIADFMAKNGVERDKFLEAFKSFTVESKVRQAKQLTDGYKIDGVPAIGVHGRYYTSGSLAGSNDRALAVTEFLIQRVRKGA